MASIQLPMDETQLTAGDRIGPALTESSNEKSKRAAPAAGAANPRPVDSGVMSQWTDWLSDPANRSMLISFGTSMLQPPAPGQSLAGQVGQAVAGAFETRDTQVKENAVLANQKAESARADRREAREESEAKSLQELRSAQATYYNGGGKKSAVNEKGDTPARRMQEALRNISTFSKLWETAQEKINLGDDEDGSAAEMVEIARSGMRAAQAIVDQASGEFKAASPVGTGTPQAGAPRTREEWIRNANNALRTGKVTRESIIARLRTQLNDPNYNGEGLIP